MAAKARVVAQAYRAALDYSSRSLQPLRTSLIDRSRRCSHPAACAQASPSIHVQLLLKTNISVFQLSACQMSECCIQYSIVICVEEAHVGSVEHYDG